MGRTATLTPGVEIESCPDYPRTSPFWNDVPVLLLNHSIVHDQYVSLSHWSTRIYDELLEQLNYTERSFSKNNFHPTVENVFCFIKYFKHLWIHENHICELRMKTWIWKRSSQNDHYLSSNENKARKKFRPVRDLNPWPLQYRYSALPVELASQLEAGHYVGSEKSVKR